MAKRVSNTIVTFILFLLLASCSGTGGTANQLEGPGIQGFAGVPWGDTRADIKAVHGEPDRVNPNPGLLKGRGHVLIYNAGGDIIGKNLPMVFMVDPEEGLLKGYYTIQLGEYTETCSELIDQVVTTLKKRYPNIKPWEGKRNPTNLDFCEAQKQGKAGMRMVWEDPETGARAGLSLVPGDTQMSVVFQSKKARKWTRVGPGDTEASPPME